MKELKLTNCLLGVLLSVMFITFICIMTYAYQPVHADTQLRVVSAFSC